MTVALAPLREEANRELRTAIYVFGPTSITIATREPCRLLGFVRRTDVALPIGTSEVAVAPGAYLVHSSAPIEVTGEEIEVVTTVEGRRIPPAPRRIFEVVPALRRSELARFVRRSDPRREPEPTIRRVLAVDDDETVLARYERGFGAERIVRVTTEPATALALATHAPFDLAIVELRIGAESGIELARALQRARPGLTVALCSRYLSVEIAMAAVHAGVDVVMFKPVTAAEILARVEQGTSYEPELDETPTLARAEWEHITRVLADCHGNVSMAARRLGIYRSSLQRRLRKYAPRR